MRFDYVKFHIRWVPTLLLVLLISLFVVLGIWQIDRAGQKRERAQVINQRAELPALELSDPIADPEVLRFRRLRARGTFEAKGQILVANRRQANRIGFHVITPLRILGSDSRVLVNRGWIPAPSNGGPVAAPIPAGKVTVTGKAYLPAPPTLATSFARRRIQEWMNFKPGLFNMPSERMIAR